MKTCTKCGKEKSLEEFSRHRNTFDGYRCWCKECCRVKNKEYYKAGDRDSSLRSKHNITKEIYDGMLEEQGGICAVCKSPDPKSRWGVFMVDHDHKCCSEAKSCGLCIRALLCFGCNAALGHVNDDVEVLRNLIEYVKDHPLPADLSERKEIALLEKRRETQRKREEGNRKIGESNTGKKKAPSIRHVTRPMSEEHRRKISDARIAWWAEQRRAIN